MSAAIEQLTAVVQLPAVVDKLYKKPNFHTLLKFMSTLIEEIDNIFLYGLI